MTNVIGWIVTGLLLLHLLSGPLFFLKALDSKRFFVIYGVYTAATAADIVACFRSASSGGLGDFVLIFLPIFIIAANAAVVLLFRGSFNSRALAKQREQGLPRTAETIAPEFLGIEAVFEAAGIFVSVGLVSVIFTVYMISFSPFAPFLPSDIYQPQDDQQGSYNALLLVLINIAPAEVVWRVWTKAVSRPESIMARRPWRYHFGIIGLVCVQAICIYVWQLYGRTLAFTAVNNSQNAVNDQTWHIIQLICFVHLIGTPFFFARYISYLRFLVSYTIYAAIFVVGLYRFTAATDNRWTEFVLPSLFILTVAMGATLIRIVSHVNSVVEQKAKIRLARSD